MNRAEDIRTEEAKWAKPNQTGHSAILIVGVERLSDLPFSFQFTEAAAAAGRNPETPEKRSTFCLDKSSLQLINAPGVDDRSLEIKRLPLQKVWNV